MHQLHLLRHAKTEVGDGLDDHERRLTKSGREAARRIGQTLPEAIGVVDLVLCSTAVRTCETLDLVIAGFAPQPPVLFERALYLASATALLRRLRQLEEGRAAVLVVGHNPGLHELALALASPDSANYEALAGGKFPTTARASFGLRTPWSTLERARQQLTGYATPKSLGIAD